MKDESTLPARGSTLPLQSQSSPSFRILVVDDDTCILQLNTEVLIGSGYEVDVVEDGGAAWDILQLTDYDLIITDNFMPKVTGIELLKKLHAARMDLPVIMATGVPPTAEFKRYPWLKPAAILTKPYDLDEMLRTVKKVLREAYSSADLVDATEQTIASLQSPTQHLRRILVVDEDKDLRLLYVDALARPGYCVDVVDDGAAGWAALQSNNYNLLITENDIPNLSGVELVKKLRAAHMALPVVMAAGRLPTHELARYPSLQLAAILEKPFDVDALRNTVENVLRAPINPPEQLDPPQGSKTPK